jgi:hypothetical protein
MKYETIRNRREISDVLARALVEKVKLRSEELNEGRLEWAFVAGYLESVLASVAAESPASMKHLVGLVK